MQARTRHRGSLKRKPDTANYQPEHAVPQPSKKFRDILNEEYERHRAILAAQDAERAREES